MDTDQLFKINERGFLESHGITSVFPDDTAQHPLDKRILLKLKKEKNPVSSKPKRNLTFYYPPDRNHGDDFQTPTAYDLFQNLSWALPYEAKTWNQKTPLVFFIRAKYKYEYKPECYDEKGDIVPLSGMVVKMFPANQRGIEASYKWVQQNNHKMDWIFRTVNLYTPNKRKASTETQLLAITSFVVDLDIKKHKDMNPEAYELWESYDDNGKANYLIGECILSGLPIPNQIQISGNGAHMFWFLEQPFFVKKYRKKNNMQRSRSVVNFMKDANKRIAKKLEHLGADSSVACPTSVLRLAGTYNNKDIDDPLLCRTIFLNRELYTTDDVFSCLTYTQEEKMLMGMTVAERCRYKAEQVRLKQLRYEEIGKEIKERKAGYKLKSKQQKKDVKKKSNFSPIHYRNSVIEDLRILADIRFKGCVASGYRDKFAHIALSVVAKTMLRTPHLLFETTCQMIRDFMPSSYLEQEFLEHSSSAIAMISKYDPNEPHENHRFSSAYYNYSIESIIDYLKITDKEQESLQTLISKHKKNVRYQERRRKERRKQGMLSRQKYQEKAVCNLKPWISKGQSRATWYRQSSTTRSMQIALLLRKNRVRQVRFNYNGVSYTHDILGITYDINSRNPLDMDIGNHFYSVIPPPQT